MNNNNIKNIDETSDLIQKSIFQNKNEQNNQLQNPMNNLNLYNNFNNEEISNFNNLNYQSNPNYESINSQNKNLNYQTNINFDNTNNQNFQSQNPQNTNFKELNYKESNDNFQNMNIQNINFQNFNQSNENFQNLNSKNQNNKINNELNQIPNYTNTFNSTYTENNPDLNKYPLNLSKYNKTGLKNIISKYNTKNLKPILNKNNRKRIILPHQNHISSKSNIDINKLLLNTKSLIKNYKFKTAYEKLKSAIHLGIYHSDLFYLYGEVNRILKNYQESEDYLLLSLNFELHSPYVFYSLGLLYQEVSQYKYSNTFFKLFNQLLNNSDVHFQMAKNYSQLGKFIKAAEQLTKAIELNKENPNYYKFRSQVYNLIGLTEMASEDQKMFNYIINSIKEEES
jgi:predicted Zn-dependent protease